ncbi:hypothetical protein BH20GEM3_BH20GEM3_09510 [soil metagenome]|jgi:carbon monoxide dehydrogenase subunit G|nr:carbon monoxide dehydrogenase subunit G [Gemmatimonadota bacterium]
MTIDGEYTFRAPRETVWELLQDPDVLVKALPGAKKLERIGADRFVGVMRVGVGPVTAAEWSVNVQLKDLLPPESYAMHMEGKSPLGFTRGTGTVTLVAEDENSTRMHYHGDVQLGGKIAGVGQRLLDQVAKLLARQGLEALNREVEARLAR